MQSTPTPEITTKLDWSPWPDDLTGEETAGRCAEISWGSERLDRTGQRLSRLWLEVEPGIGGSSWSVTYFRGDATEPEEGSASTGGRSATVAEAQEAAEKVALMVRDALCAEPGTPARHIRQRIYLVHGTLAVIGIDGARVHTIALITVTPEIITDLRSIVTELNMDEQARLLGY